MSIKSKTHEEILLVYYKKVRFLLKTDRNPDEKWCKIFGFGLVKMPKVMSKPRKEVNEERERRRRKKKLIMSQKGLEEREDTQ